MDRTADLERHIAVLRKRLEAAEHIQAALADDPELMSVLGVGATAAAKPRPVTTMAKNGKGDHSRPPDGKVGGGRIAKKYFEQIAEYLEAEGNRPKGIPEIAAAIGLKPSNVIQICYRTHRVLFDQEPIPGHKTKKQWKLKAGWRAIRDGTT